MRMTPVSEDRGDECSRYTGIKLVISNHIPDLLKRRLPRMRLLPLIIGVRLCAVALNLFLSVFIFPIGSSAERDLGLSIIVGLVIYGMALYGLPSIITIIGLLKKQLWGAWAGIVHDIMLLALILCTVLPAILVHHKYGQVIEWAIINGIFVLYILLEAVYLSICVRRSYNN